jgi:hypothetical protein
VVEAVEDIEIEDLDHPAVDWIQGLAEEHAAGYSPGLDISLSEFELLKYWLASVEAMERACRVSTAQGISRLVQLLNERR